MKNISVAVDGPAGAGKSTIAKAVADRLKIMYIDTGAMYRAVTLNIIRNNIDIDDISRIKEMLGKMNIDIRGSRIYLNEEDVSDKIRAQDINRLVSPVSAIPCVREKLIEIQRNIAYGSSVIMDGRDIGTNVLKNADVKIFLTASVEERAGRRYMELKEKIGSVDYDSVKQDIIRRDRIDSTREVNPLKKAEDAIVIDTTCKTIENVVEEIMDIIKMRWDNAI